MSVNDALEIKMIPQELSVSDATIWSITIQSSMEQHDLKIVNNCLNTNIYSYLDTSAGQSSFYI
jgi:hypothetical protein